MLFGFVVDELLSGRSVGLFMVINVMVWEVLVVFVYLREIVLLV